MANVGVRFEDYVAELLSRLGLRVLGRRVKVTVNGVEVGEVDIVLRMARAISTPLRSSQARSTLAPLGRHTLMPRY
ncbi:hypothetical protein [Vulcanisaeta distributa]|uniref:hypothetical protein n=1 Tax=Vulcanisaeta distributa TaxID=164451 RepID=UPI000AD13A19|nr:hypothetical protein [Vulcanisaeta distributa]